MHLSIADYADTIQISRKAYDLWSSGLKKSDYRQLFWSAYYQNWSKRNSCRMVYKIDGEVATSCKIVRLSLIKNSCRYKILGLGAIFTAPEWRNQGLASDLIESVISQAEETNLDGLLLFSAIDKNFYSSFGFTELGSLDFEICPQNYEIPDTLWTDKMTYAPNNKISIENRNADVICHADRLERSNGSSTKFHFSSFEPWFSENELVEIIRCHYRWLTKQPYGIVRDSDYFSFQLAKFLYFATYSTTNIAAWFLTIAKNEQKRIIGYAITECSGTSMRILDLIGDDIARVCLWQNLIEQAKNRNLVRVWGFESIARDFIPGCNLDHSLFSLKPMLKATDIQCYERTWSQPMFLPINPALSDIPNTHPCPLLEFDYF